MRVDGRRGDVRHGGARWLFRVPKACAIPLISTRVHPRGCRRWQRPPGHGGGDASETEPPGHHADEPYRVSVPLRGFRGLQEGDRNRLDRPVRSRFQSPCGVLGVCRKKSAAGVNAFFAKRFQSPCGVLGVCRDGRQGRALGRQAGVSVPLRGFRGLQESSRAGSPRIREGVVSVPLRGFRGLQVPAMQGMTSLWPEGFSPLAGF